VRTFSEYITPFFHRPYASSRVVPLMAIASVAAIISLNVNASKNAANARSTASSASVFELRPPTEETSTNTSVATTIGSGTPVDPRADDPAIRPFVDIFSSFLSTYQGPSPARAGAVTRAHRPRVAKRPAGALSRRFPT